MEETHGTALTVSGQVKWFDAHKGYGFIANLGRDRRRAAAPDMRAPVRLPAGGGGRVRGVRGGQGAAGPSGQQGSFPRQFHRPGRAVLRASAGRAMSPSRAGLPSRRWSAGSTAPRAMASSRGAPARPTSSSIWRPCAATISASCTKARRSGCGWAMGPEVSWSPKSRFCPRRFRPRRPLNFPTFAFAREAR